MSIPICDCDGYENLFHHCKREESKGFTPQNALEEQFRFLFNISEAESKRDLDSIKCDVLLSRCWWETHNYSLR